METVMVIIETRDEMLRRMEEYELLKGKPATEWNFLETWGFHQYVGIQVRY